MGRMRGCLWLTAGLVVAILAGVVAFVTLRNVATQGGAEPGTTGQLREVVVASQAITVRSRLAAEDLQVLQVPVDVAPPDAVQSIEDAVGRITLVDLFPGEILLAQRLVDPNVVSGDGRLALVIAEDEQEVLFAFPAQDLMSRVGVLKPGDHVDLLFSLNFPTDRTPDGEGGTTEQATFNLLQNLTIAAFVGGQAGAGANQNAPQAILLTVSPQDALVLKYAKDAGGIVDIVLRAPGVDVPFEPEPVDTDFMIDRYRIPIEVGR